MDCSKYNKICNAFRWECRDCASDGELHQLRLHEDDESRLKPITNDWKYTDSIANTPYLRASSIKGTVASSESESKSDLPVVVLVCCNRGFVVTRNSSTSAGFCPEIIITVKTGNYVNMEKRSKSLSLQFYNRIPVMLHA